MLKLKYVLVAGSVVGAAIALVPGGAGAATDEPSAPVVVVSGLNNPRQLSLVGNDLLIAEAGKGGTTVVNSDEGPEYIGYTGSVSEVVNPATAAGTSPNRVVTGLLSGGESPDGSFASGSDGVSTRSTHGAIYIQETYAPPDVLPAAPTSAQTGRLIRAQRGSDSFQTIANISKYEATNDPDGHGFDSNPYAVLALPDGSELVADAAGNDVLRVSSAGISTFHVFPNVTGGYKCSHIFDPTPEFPGCNYVPTSLARDAAGNIYVGSLSSLVKHRGAVTELSPDGSTVLKTWSGFTGVTGVAVGTDGSVYVSQLFAREAAPVAPGIAGVVTKIAPTGHRTNVDVPFPAGIAVDSANNVYVSAFSVATEDGLAGPGTDGQVWRLSF